MSNQLEDFNRLKRWVEECPVEAAMQIAELEEKLSACQYQYVLLEKKLKDLQEEQQKEIERLNTESNLYKRKLVSEQKRLENLRHTFYELSAFCVGKDKNIQHLLNENARLQVTEQAYEALKKAL